MFETNVFENVRLQSIPEQTSKKIKEAILEGKLKPGQSLPTLKQLSEQLGVSHPTVREALQILIDEKLIKASKGRYGGFVVNDFDPKDIIQHLHDIIALQLSIQTITPQDLIQLREMIEIPAAGIAATQRTEQDIITLEKCLATIDITANSIEEVLHADFHFHILLAKSTKNPLIYLFISAFVMTFKNNPIEFTIRHKQTIIQGLPDILEALKEKNSAKAQLAMKQHLHYSKEIYETSS